MGPALPSSLIAPPPSTSAESENGKAEAAEKSRNSTSILDSTRGLALLFAMPRERRPPLIFTSLTDRSSEEFPDGAVSVCDLAAGLAPRLEKFQSPAVVWISEISG